MCDITLHDGGMMALLLTPPAGAMMVTVYFSQVLFFPGSAAAADIGGDWFGSGPVPWLGGEQQTPFSDEAVAAAASSSIDWVAKGAVTTPISQGRCGTCAQFSATANVEAQFRNGIHIASLFIRTQ